MKGREMSYNSQKIEKNTKKRYEEAVESFVTRIKEDRNVIAVILSGSLAYDEVWGRSDIDVFVITTDEKTPSRHILLSENEVIFEVSLYSRDHFKKDAEGGLQGTALQHALSTSQVVFTRDETIREYIEGARVVGERDKELQLMGCYSRAIYFIEKATKMLYVKKDILSSFYYIPQLVLHLARMEVLMTGAIPQREVIKQAIDLNPEFFNAVYTNLLQISIDYEVLHRTLVSIEQYMEDRLEVVFKPVLDYLARAGEVRGESELNEYFGKKNIEWINYHYLAEKGIVLCTTTPIRLTSKSRSMMYEPAYYYEENQS
ncbi:MAG: nucleotidyltransferase domain-containing protein [Candidatus Hodarchaeota archaeon]